MLGLKENGYLGIKFDKKKIVYAKNTSKNSYKTHTCRFLIDCWKLM
jgi:hypothetical protein